MQATAHSGNRESVQFFKQHDFTTLSERLELSLDNGKTGQLHLEIISDLIKSFDLEDPNFRPTEIYNENWLLKAFLHRASGARLGNAPLAFARGATWFSEALLPTVFKARFRGDRRAESRTNADGVIGHILIGKRAKADLELKWDARQFTVIEAKIGSPLSSGTSNAPGFDQAARNVACMAEVLRRADLAPGKVKKLSFIILAPQAEIDAGTFASEMNVAAMKVKIQERVAAYAGELDFWYREWAKPTLEAIDLHTVSWEDAILALKAGRVEAADSLLNFYNLCLEFN